MTEQVYARRLPKMEHTSSQYQEQSAANDQIFSNGVQTVPQDISYLQRMVGNQAVGRLLSAAPVKTIIQRTIIAAWDSYDLNRLRTERTRRNGGGRRKPTGDKYEQLLAGEIDQLITYRSHSPLFPTPSQPQALPSASVSPASPISVDQSSVIPQSKAEQKDEPSITSVPTPAQPLPMAAEEYLNRFLSMPFSGTQVARFFLRKGITMTSLSKEFAYSLDSHSEEKMAGELGDAVRSFDPDAIYVYSEYSPCSNYTPLGASSFHNCSNLLALLPTYFPGVKCFLAYRDVWSGQEHIAKDEQLKIYTQSLKGLEQLRNAGWYIKKI